MADELKDSEYEDLEYYVKHNLKTFDEEAFNDVDALLLSVLVYLRYHEEKNICSSFKGISLKNLYKAEYFGEMFEKMWSVDKAKNIFAACAASPRFRDVKLKYYTVKNDEKLTLQFSAFVCSLTPNLHAVVYRGTDGTLIGWKEDALLALNRPVEAQKNAVGYINRVSKKLKGSIVVAGHSKGGNLAVYAAANCDSNIKKRIQTVYSFDGPGFYPSELEKNSYKSIQLKCRKFIPEFSVFGVLFSHITRPQIVFSNAKGVMQHNPISWKLSGSIISESFEPDAFSMLINSRLNNWLYVLEDKEKEIFVQGLFELLDSMNIETIGEIMTDFLDNFSDVIICISKMDPEKRTFMQHAIALMLSGRSSLYRSAEIHDFSDIFRADIKFADNSSDDESDESIFDTLLKKAKALPLHAGTHNNTEHAPDSESVNPDNLCEKLCME